MEMIKLNENLPIAKKGDKIRVTKFYSQGWGKTIYNVGSIWIVKEVKLKPFGVTYCEGANGVILNDHYELLKDE